MNELHKSLERIDQRIVLAFKRIEEQRNRVLELRRSGEDDASAQRLLATFICSLAIYEQRRAHLLECLLVARMQRRGLQARALGASLGHNS